MELGLTLAIEVSGVAKSRAVLVILHYRLYVKVLVQNALVVARAVGTGHLVLTLGVTPRLGAEHHCLLRLRQ